MWTRRDQVQKNAACQHTVIVISCSRILQYQEQSNLDMANKMGFIWLLVHKISSDHPMHINITVCLVCAPWWKIFATKKYKFTLNRYFKMIKLMICGCMVSFSDRLKKVDIKWNKIK